MASLNNPDQKLNHGVNGREAVEDPKLPCPSHKQGVTVRQYRQIKRIFQNVDLLDLTRLYTQLLGECIPFFVANPITKRTGLKQGEAKMTAAIWKGTVHGLTLTQNHRGTVNSTSPMTRA
jgi:hypothetical protein